MAWFVWMGEEAFGGRIVKVKFGFVSDSTVAISDLDSEIGTVVVEEEFSCSISIEVVLEPVVSSCFFSEEKKGSCLESLRVSLRDGPEEAVLVVAAVREGKFTGERGEAGSGGSGGRMGGGSPEANAGGFSPEVRPGTFQTECIGKCKFL